MLQYSYRRDAPVIPSVSSRQWLRYSAIHERPTLTWPNGARLALWICPNILKYEMLPPHDRWIDCWTRTPPPDVLAYGRQDYGVRVGFWRMLEVLDRYDLRCTSVVNSDALRSFPDICRAAVERGWDFVGHGQVNTRFTFDLDAEQERSYYRKIIDDVEQLTGVRMRGMGGPGPQVATERTIDILAELGLIYYTDVFADDQPFPLAVASGRLASLPYTVEINDPPFLGAAFEAEQFADAIMRQFDVLWREGEESGRVMCISLHGYLFGQPQRAKYLDAALRHIASAGGVWQATGGDIAQYYMDHHHDAVLKYIERSA
jgi:allantoinase